jgi:hypothetical protein
MSPKAVTRLLAMTIMTMVTRIGIKRSELTKERE